MRDLTASVVWVTGGGTGIGRAGAVALAAAGAEVVLSGRRAEPLEEVANAIAEAGGRASVLPLDVADAGAVSAVAEAILAQHGRIDILVNSAGLNVPKRRYDEVELDGWRKVIDVDLNGAFYCVAAVLPGMRERGDGLIINISSWAGRYNSTVSGPAYGAAKHAMLAMNASLNMEECVNGIRACAICPAEVATPIMDNRPIPPSADDRARMLQPEDLGETILYVARMPAHACVNEILISPTWNRAYLGGGGDR
ncbi:MAG: SDR family NAD(P)-dependent oxidoreductase [Alphaproteobacteria bacterium]|nr:SDR family NAD(P)-dependent oxidoreductase [Alphaproteobacteria bacterium]MDP6564161.1 SDR family NAD(P)-dependent oxidoreductase [Alphaproteobacteria bacterium]MDP6812639.1 SDR family NAD(P)-dependent oxidoreductase [Alphaproteobacteria bacterium]